MTPLLERGKYTDEVGSEEAEPEAKVGRRNRYGHRGQHA